MSQFLGLPSCALEDVPGVPETPAALAALLGSRPDVTATAPVPTSVGGLSGVRIDLRLKPGAKLPHCIDQSSGEGVDYQPLMVGRDPTDFDHGLVEGVSWRQYLLAYKGGVAGIEIDDVDSAPGTLDSLGAVAERLRFATG